MLTIVWRRFGACVFFGVRLTSRTPFLRQKMIGGKKMKKIISMLLVLTVICSTLICATVTANADSVIESALSWALDTANDNSHRYVLGASHSENEGTHYDCSSFVSWALRHAGLDVPISTTFVMRDNFEPFGFEWIPWSSIGGTYNLQRGDILLDEDTHVEFYYGNNQMLGAHNPNSGISLYGYYNNAYGVSWDGVLRYNAESEPLNIGEDFYAMIINTKCWKPISLVDGSDRVFLKTENGKSRELWHFIRQEDGAYVILSCFNGKALEMHNGEREVCTQLSAHDDYWGGYYQQWYIYAQGEGYILKSKHYSDEDWVMDLYAADPTDGNVIQINHRNNSQAQVWSIYRDVYRNIGEEFNATISNVNYGTYVSKATGTDNIFLQDKTNTAKQLWHFKKQDDHAYVITSCYDNKALEMTNGTRENGVQISAFDNYWGGYYQQWYFLPFGDGYKIISKHYTGERWVLDRSAQSSENGNIVQIYKNSGFDDQVWCINKNDAYADLGDEFNATVRNAKYQNYLAKVTGTNAVFLRDKNINSRQLWHFKRQSDGAYAITSCYDEKALEMTNGTRENGTQITAHDTYWEGYYQQWYLLPLGDGYKLLNKHYTNERWLLNRSERTTENGNIVQIYENNNNDNQIFQIEIYSGAIPATLLLGDVNGDDDVDSVDATIIQRICTMIQVPFAEEQLMRGDVDGDGSLTTVDATFIQRYSTRVTTPYHIGELITQ